MTFIDLRSVIEDAGYDRGVIAGRTHILLKGDDTAMVWFYHIDGTARSFTVSVTINGEILVHRPLGLEPHEEG